MKKLFMAVLVVVFFAPVAFGGGWGLGAKLGVGENDPKTLNQLLDYYGGKLSEGNGIFGVEGFHEWDLEYVNKLGVKFGFDFYGENEFKKSPYKITEEIYALPVSVYFKQDYGVENWSWFAGAGITFIKGEVDDGPDTYKDSKLFPHLLVGGEYRFTEVFALGLEAKYNINAELRDKGYKTDRSGISGAVTFRFYL